MIKFYKNVLTENQKIMLKYEIKEFIKGVIIILGITALGIVPFPA